MDARYARHDDKEWVGYRTHLTETCDAEAPIHLITHVETVLAPTQDVEVTETIYADLEQQDLNPRAHCRRSLCLGRSPGKGRQADGIELVGPVTKIQDVSWQAREQTGYDLSRFKIDWDNKQ